VDNPENVLVRCDCGARLAAPPKLFGRTIGCPGCGAELQIPGSPSEEPTPVPSTSPMTANAGETVPLPGVALPDPDERPTVPETARPVGSPGPHRAAEPAPRAPEPQPRPPEPPRPAPEPPVPVPEPPGLVTVERPQAPRPAPRTPSRVTIQERVTAAMPGAEVSGPQVVVNRGLAPERTVALPAARASADSARAPDADATAPSRAPVRKTGEGRGPWAAALGVWVAAVALGLGYVVALLAAGATGSQPERERLAAFAFVGLIGLAVSGGGVYLFWRRVAWIRTASMAAFAAAAVWNLREVVAAAVLLSTSPAPALARAALPLDSGGWVLASLVTGAVGLVLDVTFLTFAARAGAAFRPRGR